MNDGQKPTSSRPKDPQRDELMKHLTIAEQCLRMWVQTLTDSKIASPEFIQERQDAADYVQAFMDAIVETEK